MLKTSERVERVVIPADEVAGYELRAIDPQQPASSPWLYVGLVGRKVGETEDGGWIVQTLGPADEFTSCVFRRRVVPFPER